MTIEQLQEQLKEAQEQNRRGNYTKAEEMIGEILASCDELHKQNKKINIDQIRAFGNGILADSLSKRGHFQKALPIAETALSYYMQSDQSFEKMHCCILLEEIYRGMSDYTNAVNYLHQAENFAIQIGNQSYIIDIKIITGCLFMDTGKISDAIAIFSDIVNNAQQAEFSFHRQCSIGNLGACYQLLGNYKEAINCYHSALKFSQNSNNIFHQATCLGNIGTLFVAQGDYINGLSYFQESLLLYQRIDSRVSIGKILTDIASAYRGMGEYQLSLKHSLDALEILEQCGDIKQTSQCIGNIAILYSFLENFDKSEHYFLMAIKMLNDINSHASSYLGNYGKLLHEYGHTDRAIHYLQKAILLFQQSQNIIEENQYNYYLCKIHINNNKFDKAKEIAFRRYQVFCEHSRNDEIPSSLQLLGDLYSNPAFDEYNVELAEQYYLQSINKFTELGNKHGLYDAHQHIAQFYKQHNRWEEYAANIEKSMELYKEVQNDEVKKQADRFGWERKIAEMEKEKEVEKVRTEAEKKLLEQQVAFQKREVETTIHELVNKNSLLHEVRKDVQTLSKHTIREGQDVVERLLDRLERNIVPLESKSDLEKQWSEIHAPFMELMKHRYPTLTTMELKICALLKMKLTSSNICSILFLSKRTVEFHRLNIRKKMGLSKNDDIHVILSSLL